MPKVTALPAPAYLREARLEAGYSSRDIAAMDVAFSPETIGRHERGEVPFGPEDAMRYAETYKAPDILIRFCAGCPIGKKSGKTVTDRDIPWAVLRLTNRLRKAGNIAETLERIADDGVIDANERGEFDAALDFLRNLEETIMDIKLAASQKERSRSDGTEATPNELQQNNNNRPGSVCQSSI